MSAIAIARQDALAYPNQRKLIRLSDDTLVALVVGITHPTLTDVGTIMLSKDDGETWYEATVGGVYAAMRDGAISSYVDSGGVERLVLVWANGVGGGRTDGSIYASVGTFTSDRSDVTFGNPLEIANATGGTDYGRVPDLVCHAEGTGGVAHVAHSWLSTTPSPDNCITYHKTVPISSAGVASLGVSTLLGTHAINDIWTTPSIDIDPATKRLHLAWSAGTTGAGNGIRYRTASYSAGAWTWAAEVEVNTGVYTNNSAADRIIWWLKCRWDGTRIVIGGFMRDAANSFLRTYESTNFTAFTTREHENNVTAENNFRSGGMAINAAGDIYFYGQDSTRVNVGYRKWTRNTNVLGARVVLDQFTTGSAAFVNVEFLGGKIRWIYQKGNNSNVTLAHPYAIVYDDDTGRRSVVAGSRTNRTSGATHASSGKRLLVLSTGRMIAAIETIAETGGPNNTRFFRSDDGKTWHDMACDIEGGSRCAIAAYVDSGGTERIVAAFRNYGTGNGRTNLMSYVMMGAFDAARNTIQWISTSGALDTNYDYPDVVAHAEGTGGRIHHIAGILQADFRIYARRWDVSATGVLSNEQFTLLGTYVDATPQHGMPSLALDPATKRLHAVWAASDLSGVGFGIRYRTASYAADVWTWAAEVAVDETHKNDINGYKWANVRYDAAFGRAVIIGILSDGANDDLMAYFSNAGFTAFTTQVLSENEPGVNRYNSGNFVILPNGDIYLVGVSAGSDYSLRYVKLTRTSATAVTVNLATDPVVYETGYYLFPTHHAVYVDQRIRWIWTGGNNAPYQVRANEIDLRIPVQGASMLVAL